MSRLPSIDTNARTLIVTGFPNVGKSSFINNVTNANVDVQPYAFTTQNLFVGHTDYKYARWQVIDTPGILDHPLDQRNTIEMQAVTALAHLNAAILFLLDISESCGYTIDQQIALFQSIKPLFQAKPLVLVLTKSDLQKFTELAQEERSKVETLAREANAYLIQMSNISGDGIADVKSKACDILLDHRLTQKAKDPKKQEAILNRLHVSQPKKRDNIDRPSFVPEAVTNGSAKKEGPTVKELQEEYGGAGNFYIPVEEHFMLDKEEWRYDQFPEFYNGSNVLDFYDPDIERKLDALEKEEAQILKNEHADLMEGVESEDEDGVTMEELKASLAEVRQKKAIFKNRHKLKGKLVVRDKKAKVSEMIEHFENIGVNVNKESLRSRSKTRRSIGELEGA